MATWENALWDVDRWDGGEVHRFAINAQKTPRIIARVGTRASTWSNADFGVDNWGGTNRIIRKVQVHKNPSLVVKEKQWR